MRFTHVQAGIRPRAVWEYCVESILARGGVLLSLRQKSQTVTAIAIPGETIMKGLRKIALCGNNKGRAN